ncbi:MAG: flagellar basal body-associated FliL family protein [Moorellaceae bacterium]
MAVRRGRTEEEETPKGKGKGKKSWLTILLVVVVLLMSGGFGYFYLSGNRSTAGENSGKEVRQAEIHKLTLESFVVNLADPGLRRYLRTKITLEYTNPRLEGELNEKLHRIRDAIIAVLRSKKTEELSQEEALKRELLTAVNSQLESGQVRALYFEEFIVQ